MEPVEPDTLPYFVVVAGGKPYKAKTYLNTEKKMKFGYGK